MKPALHARLDCGAEFAALQLPDRRAVAIEFRMLAGMVDEPGGRLGLAHLVQQTINKGTNLYDGRALSDAFDEIGAVVSSGCGREAVGFLSLCLPEFFDRNVELHAEFLRNPTFPDEPCEVAVELSRQELLTLEDDPQALCDKLICRHAFGPLLGRHVLGERATLDAINRDDFVRYWKENYCAGRMLVSVAGPLDPDVVASTIERSFSGFGPAAASHREPMEVEFTPATTHHLKDTEQVQIAIALPGVPMDHEDYAAERLLLGVLSGGMSARLFTEVREKQGLVYWVSAWHENPRGAGMIFLRASTTPQRCDQTHATLLRELDRVGRDVTDEEIERARTGICVRADIRSDVTRSRCSEQADDLMHFGRPVPWEEKRARLEAVGVSEIARYHAKYVNSAERSVVTLGPRVTEEGAEVECRSSVEASRKADG